MARNFDLELRFDGLNSASNGMSYAIYCGGCGQRNVVSPAVAINDARGRSWIGTEAPLT
jgi:hypothetical protein